MVFSCALCTVLRRLFPLAAPRPSRQDVVAADSARGRTQRRYARRPTRSGTPVALIFKIREFDSVILWLALRHCVTVWLCSSLDLRVCVGGIVSLRSPLQHEAVVEERDALQAQVHRLQTEAHHVQAQVHRQLQILGLMDGGCFFHQGWRVVIAELDFFLAILSLFLTTFRLCLWLFV